MNHGKKKSSSRAAIKQGPPFGLIVALALAGGVVLGSGGTYLYFKPLVAAKQAAPPDAGGMPQTQTVAAPAMPAMPPQQQFTPAPQPPGPPPPGKVWSVEHGHWHDAPVAQTTPAPVPLTVTPAAPPPPPAVAPAEKKE